MPALYSPHLSRIVHMLILPVQRWKAGMKQRAEQSQAHHGAFAYWLGAQHTAGAAPPAAILHAVLEHVARQADHNVAISPYTTIDTLHTTIAYDKAWVLEALEGPLHFTMDDDLIDSACLTTLEDMAWLIAYLSRQRDTYGPCKACGKPGVRP